MAERKKKAEKAKEVDSLVGMASSRYLLNTLNDHQKPKLTILAMVSLSGSEQDMTMKSYDPQ